jgi:hypothetical protein
MISGNARWRNLRRLFAVLKYASRCGEVIDTNENIDKDVSLVELSDLLKTEIVIDWLLPSMSNLRGAAHPSYALSS